jgi:hypothetical protein
MPIGLRGIRRHLKSATRIALLTLAGFSIAGCLESKNPVAPRSMAVADPRLEGSWASLSEDISYELRIRSKGNGSLEMRLLDTSIFFGAPRSEARKEQVYDAYVVTIGEHHIVNFRRIADADEENPTTASPSGNWVFAEYGFVDNPYRSAADLWVRFFDWRLFSDAVTSGRLRGEVKKSDHDTEVLLTDDSWQIAMFIANVMPESSQRIGGMFRRLPNAHW